MSYATYSAYTGLPQVSPNQAQATFRNSTRDRVKDNVTVTRKLRLVKGAQIRSKRQSATISGPDPNLTVSMPYTGNMTINIVGGPLDLANGVIVNNPFINGNKTRVTVNAVNANGGTATLGSVVLTRGSGYVMVGGVGTVNDEGSVQITVAQ